MATSYFDIKSELINIIPEELKLGIQESLLQNNVKTNAELILSLCQIITSKIDIYIVQQYSGWTKNYYSLYKRRTDLSKEAENELMVYGAKLIYLLRTFINDESINFHMASFDANHKYKADAFIPQEQILKNLSAVKKNAVGVSSSVQKYLIDNNQRIMQNKRENLWKRVEYLSEPLYKPGRNISKIDMQKNKNKKAHWAYQNQKKDILIYLKFSGNHLEKYYDVDGTGKLDSLQHFNNGWLWEWYNAILYGGTEDQYLYTNSYIKRGSIQPIIQNKDFTPGTKQGDFKTITGQQIQSKYGNEKIISFNNIRSIIYNLEIALSAFVKDADNVQIQKNLLSVLQQHFIPESVNIGNSYANNIAEDIINKFRSSVKI